MVDSLYSTQLCIYIRIYLPLVIVHLSFSVHRWVETSVTVFFLASPL
jgi:hypothetical protein